MVVQGWRKTPAGPRGSGHRAGGISDAAGQAELRRPPTSARRTERPLRAVGSAARLLPFPRQTHLVLSCVSLLANMLAKFASEKACKPIQARAFGRAGRCRKDSVQRGNRTIRAGPIRPLKRRPSPLLPLSNHEGRKNRFDSFAVF